MLKTLIYATAMAAVAATPALALKVSKSIEIAAPPEKVWETIGEFCGIADWHPVIEKCELSTRGETQIRTLSLKGGGSIVEEQVSRNDPNMNYTYKIIESPLPVSDYESTIKVTPSGEGSKVTWWGEFKAKGADDAKAEETIGGVYEAGLKGIADEVK
ncbi:SRPBCC family protein [Methylocella tundrae]|uniref:SRPBCC family protein n=1 Tax=Methylocella tundrae TaxID=227605 RepID=A0A4V6IMV5_METTU|nr:SRPBCC family protein [Methylocella tundrae]WPP03753.1 SRPBCC family protein [Methylocella tundrae]VFU09909.1 conserved exported protein of unknown function [Methylocella tundrae]